MKKQRSAGRPSVGPRQQFTIRLDEQTAQELRLYCAVTRATVGGLALDAMTAWWAQNPERAKYQKMAKEASK
jgi:hypothetical protein